MKRDKIEIIKEDVYTFQTTTEANINWLLQRLERYETALKEILDIDDRNEVIYAHGIAEKALEDETHT